jgi:DNA-binding beta-propeller fold protein YncE
MTTNSHIRIFWLVAVLLIPSVLPRQKGDELKVSWIDQFPAENGGAKKSLGERISTLLMGPEPMALIKPFGVVAIQPDDFWILDQGAGTIVHADNGRGTMLRSMHRVIPDFPSLVGICAEPGGDLFCSDSKLNQVFRVGEDKTRLFSDRNTLRQPTGMAYHPGTGELWVAETGAHRIAVFTLSGVLVKRIGMRGKGPGQFNYPTFLWIDREGRIYVVDSMNFRIQLLDNEGNYISSFGRHGDGSGDLARPKGVATDSYGNIYVTDALFHVVQIFNADGEFLDSFGGQGQGQGEFWMPAGIYIDQSDHIFVADSYNSRIQVFKLETRE